MKKITFKQKLYNFWNNEKFRKVRDITLFISLGINLLIFILFGVVGCSIKADTSNDQTTQNQLVQHRKELNNTVFTNGDIVKVDIPPVFTPQDRMTIDYWFSCGDYGLLFNDDRQYHSNNEYKIYTGNVINWKSSNNDMYIDFYNYNDERQCRYHYEYDGGIYLNDSYDIATLYLTYLKDNTYNNYFINFFNDLGYVHIVDNTFSFGYSWSIYDYVDSNGGLTSVEYSNSANHTKRFLLNTTFYSNGMKFDSMYFEFSLPNEWTTGNELVGAYMDKSGNLCFLHSDDTYKYIFKGLYYANTTNNNTVKVAMPTLTTYVNNTGNALNNSYSGIKNYVADTFYWLNESWQHIKLTGANYVEYINAPLFEYNYNEGWITLDDQPNDSGYTYINYSYLASNNGISIYGDYNNTIYSPIDLLSTAFVGLRKILDITILPHITIGLLLFMPLVVAIIVILFRVVKK